MKWTIVRYHHADCYYYIRMNLSVNSYTLHCVLINNFFSRVMKSWADENPLPVINYARAFLCVYGRLAKGIAVELYNIINGNRTLGRYIIILYIYYRLTHFAVRQ